MMPLSTVKGRVAAILATLLLCSCAATGPEVLAPGRDFDLGQALAQQRLETLYYDDLPPRLAEFVERPGILGQLGEAYSHEVDPVNRFNIVVILNRRARKFADERPAVREILRGALSDQSAWVRTEAVWGYGFLGNQQQLLDVAPLLDDENPGVVNEAILALARMAGDDSLPPSLPLSNQQMSDEARARAVQYWKDRLASPRRAAAQGLAAGWTPENLRLTIAGCRAAVIAGAFEAMAKKEGLSADRLPAVVKDDLAKAMEPYVYATCDCAISEVAKELPAEDFDPSSPRQQRALERMKALVEMGVCAPSVAR